MSVTHTTICNMIAGEWFCLDRPRQLVLMLVAGAVLGVLLLSELADRCWVAAALRYVGWRVDTDFEEEE